MQALTAAPKVSLDLNKETLPFCKSLLKNSKIAKTHSFDLKKFTHSEFQAYLKNTPLFYGTYISPFGLCLGLATHEGLCALEILDSSQEALLFLKGYKEKYTPQGCFENEEIIAAFLRKVFLNKPVPLLLVGTNLQQKVFEHLLKISPGSATTYETIAIALKKPKAYRAIANAVGSNPLTYIVPCHRVFRKNAELGGFRGGPLQKLAFLKAEAKEFEKSRF